MATMLCTKTQLAILDEVVEKSDDGKPINIDISDPIREWNFHELDKQGYFLYPDTYEQQAIAVLFGGNPPSIIGLTDEGHRYHHELEKELWKQEQTERQTKASEGANTRSTVALIISGIATLIALIALLVSWLK